MTDKEVETMKRNKDGEVVLEQNEVDFLVYAVLPNYAQAMEQAVEQFNQLAEHLAAGGEFPLFASGEPGVRAAHGMAEQFARQGLQATLLGMEILESEEVN